MHSWQPRDLIISANGVFGLFRITDYIPMRHIFLSQGLGLFQWTCKTTDTKGMEIHVLWMKSNSWCVWRPMKSSRSTWTAFYADIINSESYLRQTLQAGQQTELHECFYSLPTAAYDGVRKVAATGVVVSHSREVMPRHSRKMSSLYISFPDSCDKIFSKIICKFLSRSESYIRHTRATIKIFW